MPNQKRTDDQLTQPTDPSRGRKVGHSKKGYLRRNRTNQRDNKHIDCSGLSEKKQNAPERTTENSDCKSSGAPCGSALYYRAIHVRH